MIGRHLLGVLARDEQREMTSDVAITRAAGAATFDKATATYTDGDRVAVYDGACFVRPAGRRVVQHGETAVTLRVYELRLPLGGRAPREGDDVDVRDSIDPALVGKRLVVADVPAADRPVVRRITAIEAVQ